MRDTSPIVRILTFGNPRKGAVPADPRDFLRQLGAASVLMVPGRDTRRTRAVVTLLHGDEPSGFLAVHRWLTSGTTAAVNVLVFIGAVGAALEPPGFAHRHLPGRVDLNRCFLPPWRGDEALLARRALDIIRHCRPEALVDLHNTSGSTQPFGLAVGATPVHLGLTSLFAPIHLDAGTLRLGSLVEATEETFPSVVIECGRSGDPAADDVAWQGLSRYLALEALDSAVAAARITAVFQNPVRIRLRAGLRLAFAPSPVAGAHVTLLPHVEDFNLRELAPGTVLGWSAAETDWPFSAQGRDGKECSSRYLAMGQGRIRVREPFTPLMMTTDPVCATNDCLFYVVQGDRAHEVPASRSGRDGPGAGSARARENGLPTTMPDSGGCEAGALPIPR